MAEATIDRAHVEMFKSNVIMLAQQRGSRLRDKVTVEVTPAAVANFERLGATADVEKTAQDAATPDQSATHDRRQVVLRDWHWAKRIDWGDSYRTLIDIAGKYTQAGMWAVGRRWDSLILAAALGNAQSKVPDGVTVGQYTVSNVALPASQLVAHGGVSLTLDKLIEAKHKLLKNDVDEDMDPIFIAVNSFQLHELLKVTEVKSADYNSVKALVDGRLDTFMGFKFVRTELVANDATNDNCVAWCKSGIGLAIGQELKSRYSERDDLSYSGQIYLSHAAEATRIEEEKVVQIDCLDEA